MSINVTTETNEYSNTFLKKKSVGLIVSPPFKCSLACWFPAECRQRLNPGDE